MYTPGILESWCKKSMSMSSTELLRELCPGLPSVRMRTERVIFCDKCEQGRRDPLLSVSRNDIDGSSIGGNHRISVRISSIDVNINLNVGLPLHATRNYNNVCVQWGREGNLFAPVLQLIHMEVML